MSHDNQPRPLPPSRTDELLFRRSMPRAVDGFDIIEAVHWRPGDRGGYAAAWVVTAQAERLSTHVLFWGDDHLPEPGVWYIEYGRYGIGTLEEARADARRRAGVPYLYQPPVPAVQYAHVVSVIGGNTLSTYTDQDAAERDAALVNEKHGGDLVSVQLVGHHHEGYRTTTDALEYLRRAALGEA